MPTPSRLLAGMLIAAAGANAQDPQQEFGRDLMRAVREGRSAAVAELARAEPDRAAAVARNVLRAAARTPNARDRAAAGGRVERIIEAMNEGALRAQLLTEVARWQRRDEAQRRRALDFEQAMASGQQALMADDATTAEAAGDAAVSAARELGEPYLEARARGLRGVARGKRSRWDAAIADLEAATSATSRLLARFDHAGDCRELAILHEGRSRARSESGDYEGALAGLLSAIELWRQVEDRVQRGRCLVQVGGALSELARFADAEAALREALEIFRDPGPAHARALIGLALCRLDQSKPARTELHAASAMARLFGDPVGEAEARRHLGRLLLDADDPAGAEREFARAVDLATTDLARVLALTGLGDAAAQRGDADRAAKRYERAISTGSHLAEGAWRAHVGLGRLLEGRDRRAALAHYQRAVSALEALRQMLQLPALRQRALAERRAPYVAAARLLAAFDDVDAAFATIERLRARTLWEAAAGARAAATSPRQRHLESELLRVERAIESARPDDAGTLVARRSELRSAHERERLRSALDAPQRAAASGDRAAALADVQLQLGERDALVTFAVDLDTTLALVVRRTAVRPIELPIGAARLDGLVDELVRPFAELARGETDTGNLRFAARTAHRLHRELIEPLPLDGVGRLWLVADGPLRRVPFAALVTRYERRPVDPAVPYAQYHGCRYLIEERELAMLPAAALLAAKPTRAAIAGDPLVVGHELPGAVREAEQIARLLATEPSAAGEAGVTIGLRTCSIAHLATHAELDRRRPAFARLQLAADAENDGWLHAYEIARLGLARRPLVVLSGCVTAGHADRAHGLLGLLSAFLGAGARCVVATHWQVEDRASLELMQRFHRAEADPVTALTEAQRAVLARGRGDVSGWSHPLYWAAYALYGRP